MNGKRLTGLLTVTAVAVLGWLGSRAETVRPQALAAAPSTAGFAFRGTASCSGRACHGGLDTTGAKGCEYTTWLLHDPHRKAYSVLIEGKPGELARRMIKALHPEDPHARPETATECLVCHGPVKETTGVAYGFGCESCHGPAEKWLAPHTASKEWAKVSAPQKRALGFQPMDRLEDRARACTACHVGEKGREVNHDLIAAGHPRLNFEFDTFLANLPRHWQPSHDADPSAAWLVGQAMSSEAALKLMASRAERTAAPWPEFTEHDCYACHHDFKADSRRQQRGYGSRIPGTLPLAEWYFTMPAALAETEASGENLKKLLGDVSRQMSQPLPDRARVAKTATAAAAIEPWLKSAKPPRCSAFLSKLIADGRAPFVKQEDQKVTITSWDAAAQVALALRAEALGKGQTPAAELDKELRELFRLLQYSEDNSRDSPGAFDGPTFVEQANKVCGLLNAAP